MRSRSMKKKWLIVSHERSGTEWVIASIIKNLYPDLYQATALRQASWDVDGERFCDPEVMEAFLLDNTRPRSKLIYGNAGTTMIGEGNVYKVPFKSHHAYNFFEPIWGRILDQFHVVYVMRDGRDVMTSMWHHGWDDAGFMPKAFSVQQFIRLQPTPEMGRYHGDYFVENMSDRWAKHIASWCGIPDVLYVSYEELSYRYEDTIKRIAYYADEQICSDIVSPPLTGISPWRGKVGVWREYIAKADLGQFWVNAYAAMGTVAAHNNELQPGYSKALQIAHNGENNHV